MNAGIEKLLRIQEIEQIVSDAFTVHRERLTATPEWSAMVGAAKASVRSTLQLEKEAEDSLAEYEKLKEIFYKNHARVRELATVNVDELQDDESTLLNNEIEQLLKTLRACGIISFAVCAEIFLR